MYSCQEEYEAAMNAQGEAEAEYENHRQYLEYLDELATSDPYMYALEIGIDILSQSNSKSEFDKAIEVLRKEKDAYIDRKTAAVDAFTEEITEQLPF